MNINVPPPAGAVPWEQVRTRLDQNGPFANMYDTPLYRDAVWEQFSETEYARRYAALRAKMREAKLDAVIVPGGPSHWSFGGGMTWLTGHWEWHALSSYVLVPLEDAPTLVFSMGGTHCEAVRRQVAPALADVRHSRGGRYAEVMVERCKEIGPHRPRRDRPAPQGLSAGQPVQRPARRPARRRAGVHPQLHPRAGRHQERRGARLRAPGGRAVRAGHAGDGGGGEARRDRGRPARRRRRGDAPGRRRHRLPDHRLDPDGQPGDVLR
jgi:hypothetical protein